MCLERFLEQTMSFALQLLKVGGGWFEGKWGEGGKGREGWRELWPHSSHSFGGPGPLEELPVPQPVSSCSPAEFVLG